MISILLYDILPQKIKAMRIEDKNVKLQIVNDSFLNLLS